MVSKLALVEVFRSVQGEGFNAGRDSIFVRFAGCNLACAFAEDALCDTPYMNAKMKVTLDELFDDIIEDLLPGGPPEVTARRHAMMMVITGGEPTLAPAFDELVVAGQDAGFYVTVETNGTRWRDGLALADFVSCSPKEAVPQESPSPNHNQNPQDPTLDPAVIGELYVNPGEYRYVIAGRDAPAPEWRRATACYLSPAVISDGTGQLWKKGFPGFVDGSVERCLEIVEQDPRWRISIQTHKLLGVR